MNNEEIVRMAKEVGGYVAELYVAELPSGSAWLFDDDTMLERFAALVAAHEREACAKVFDEMAYQMVADMEPSAAIAWVRNRAEFIRARGKK